MSIPERFTVIREVGAGGMGVVYEVSDAKFPGVRRALKVLRPGRPGDPKPRELFVKEVTATASIKSEHVVQVIDYDVTAASPWMLMELLSGETLDTRVAAHGALPWEEARRLVTELGHALGAAHAVGQLHLDLKPSNLFLARSSDAYGTTRLKVLDFGLSRQIMEGKSHVLQSMAMGTMAWMPPEQGSKKAQLRETADVWPFGLIAFWMLTAKHYWLSFDDDGELDNVNEFYGELATGAVTTASERARERGSVRPLPAGFDAWFAKCVAKVPSDRWSDGGVASRELEALLGRASSVSSAPPAVPVARGVSSRDLTVQAERPQVPAGFTAPVSVVFPAVPAQGGAQSTVAVSQPSLLGASPPWSLLAGGGGLLALLMLGGWALSDKSVSPTRDAAAGTVLAANDAVVVIPPAPTATSCPSDMALIPAGSFMMGSPEGQGDLYEHPQHSVRLDTFCMDRTEVSVSAYRACVTAGPCTAPDDFVDAEGNPRIFCNWGRAGAEDHPVNCVDWPQSKRFCEWSGHNGGARRLPREAEWEYAARGTANRPYPWGSAAPDGTLTNLCGDECARYYRSHGFPGQPGIARWHDDYGMTAPVTAFSAGATPEGVLNLGGNVWEWVEDVYAADAYARHTSEGVFAREVEASQVTENRVFRGGGWYGYDASRVRAADRNWNGPADRYYFLGFRCARGEIGRVAATSPRDRGATSRGLRG